MFDLLLAAERLSRARASRRSAAEAAALFAFIGFNGWFHTSLVHLMQWRIDTDGLEEKQPKDGRSLDTCAHPGPFVFTAGKTLFPFCFMTLLC